MMVTPIRFGNPQQPLPLFRLGFRPFFLGAGLFAIVGMSFWMAAYTFSLSVLPSHLPPMVWHAHEMIYGYTFAVLAGFLLTAIRNWTDIPTIRGGRLFAVFLLWALARCSSLLPGQSALILAGMLDGLFAVFLCLALAAPILQAKQWPQLGIIGKVLVLMIGNALYYLGIAAILPNGVQVGLSLGLYTILSLIFVLARRVLPMFLARALGQTVQVKNHSWVDGSSLPLFVAFVIADLFLESAVWAAWLALALCAVHGLRLWGWYRPGLWQKPLLWVLYVAYAWIVFGFGLKWAVWAVDISPSLAIHAWATGGIGLMTLGMMARVSLGHTGRNVLEPPTLVGPLFLIMVGSACLRVLFPLFWPALEHLWVGCSQGLWIAAFSLFVILYAPILLQPSLESEED